MKFYVHVVVVAVQPEPLLTSDTMSVEKNADSEYNPGSTMYLAKQIRTI